VGLSIYLVVKKRLMGKKRKETTRRIWIGKIYVSGNNIRLPSVQQHSCLAKELLIISIRPKTLMLRGNWKAHLTNFIAKKIPAYDSCKNSNGSLILREYNLKYLYSWDCNRLMQDTWVLQICTFDRFQLASK